MAIDERIKVQQQSGEIAKSTAREIAEEIYNARELAGDVDKVISSVVGGVEVLRSIDFETDSIEDAERKIQTALGALKNAAIVVEASKSRLDKFGKAIDKVRGSPVLLRR